MNLSGKTIRLRQMEQKDLDLKIRWYNDKQINQTLILTEKLTLDKTISWFNQASHDPTRLDCMIETLDGNPVGLVGLVNIDQTHLTAESIIVIGEPEYWGRGVMLEALGMLLQWSFETLNLYKIWALALPDNIASLITMKKLGYQIEGTLRQEKCLSGHRTDIIRLGLLRTEFKKY